MLVMDTIAQILKREGISTLFYFPTTPIIEAAVAAGLRPIICRQERVGRPGQLQWSRNPRYRGSQ